MHICAVLPRALVRFSKFFFCFILTYDGGGELIIRRQLHDYQFTISLYCCTISLSRQMYSFEVLQSQDTAMREANGYFLTYSYFRGPLRSSRYQESSETHN